MKRSLNEISGMVLKAARGAGVPFGHCEDLAGAAAYIAATDPEALAVLADVLATPYASPTCITTDQKMQISRTSAAASSSLAVDAIRAGYQEVQIKDVQAPTVIFALFASQGIAVSHRFEGDDLLLFKSDAPAPASITAGAATVPQQLWQILSDLAAKTYVPASDASRLAGAGAGLTDND